MNDTRNFIIAWGSSLSTLFAAIESGTMITAVSAIVLPIIFFAAGKTIDILLQIHLRRRDERRNERKDSE